MRSSNTFGLHFVLRPAQKGNHAIYVRIVVNRTRCELALKQTIDKKDEKWGTYTPGSEKTASLLGN
jgi:hypothetical protein